MKTTIKTCGQCKSGEHVLHIRQPDGIEIAVHRTCKGWLFAARGTYGERRSIWIGGRKTLRAVAGAILRALSRKAKP